MSEFDVIHKKLAEVSEFLEKSKSNPVSKHKV